MSCGWYFRIAPSDNFSNVSAFRPKSHWKLPTGHRSVELFLSRLKKELFSLLPGKPRSYIAKEEWKAMRNLLENRSIIIKPADKGSSVVIWDQEDYLSQGERQLSDHSTYLDVKKFSQMSNLPKKSSRIFKGLCNKKPITEKIYFSLSFKNSCYLGKMNLPPKI